MWIFMNHAMLSIVKHNDLAGTLLVRARIEVDIERGFPDAVVERTPEGGLSLPRGGSSGDGGSRDR